MEDWFGEAEHGSFISVRWGGFKDFESPAGLLGSFCVIECISIGGAWKTEESTIILGNWIAGFRGFKLMEISVATAVFQVVSQYFGLENFDKLGVVFFF